MTITVRDWKSVEKNTLRGFFTLDLGIGLMIKDCMLHTSHGRWWIGLPAKPTLDTQGRQITKDGKGVWTPIVLFGERDSALEKHVLKLIEPHVGSMYRDDRTLL